MSHPKQKALLLESKHGNFVISDISVPRPNPGEVLVKLKSTALNPIDWKVHKTSLSAFITDYPAILGTDAAGDVEEVGEGVTQWKKGDRVFFQGTFENRGATFQEYTIGVANTIAKIPDNISYDQAATMPVTLTCAYVGLYNKNPHGLGFEPPIQPSARGKYAGTPLVVLGGASSVGQYVIQLAKASGFSPIITTASAKHTEYLQSFGATHIVDRHIPLSSLDKEVGKLTSEPIKFVFDAISSPETQQAGYELVAPGGQILVVLKPAVQSKEGDDKTVVYTIGVLNLPHNIDLLRGMYATLTGLLEEEVITPNKVEVIAGGLSGITEGLQRLEDDQVSGVKLVVRPQETA